MRSPEGEGAGPRAPRRCPEGFNCAPARRPPKGRDPRRAWVPCASGTCWAAAGADSVRFFAGYGRVRDPAPDRSRFAGCWGPAGLEADREEAARLGRRGRVSSAPGPRFPLITTSQGALTGAAETCVLPGRGARGPCWGFYSQT